jgi:glycosyltransferase involved in cell wall biosynthesis
MHDFAVVGSDPGFGGGGRALTEALWRAAEELGREPELHYLHYRRLPTLDRDPVFTRRRSVSPLPFPDIEAIKNLAAATVIATRVRGASSCFVSAAVASHGYGAVLARRPYGCWTATSIADEWAARRHGVDRARRIAHAAGRPLLHALERATLRRAKVLWAISPASRASLVAAAGIPEDGIRVVPIPVDLERFAPLGDSEWEERLARPELVFVGRAGDPRKNVALLLDAFERLRPRVPGVRLTLVGAPPTTSLPPGVEATGEVASVAERVRCAALFVLPSLQEGLGLVVAEALAAGVPVLVTPCGGPEDLVRASEGGEVLSGFDPEELADRVVALLGDRGRLLAMRRQGHAHVMREHDPAHLRDALREALEELGGS